MNYLHLLSEDDNDDVFYRSCLSKITAQSYEVISKRLRKGGGLREVRKKLPILLNQLKYTGEVPNTFFLVAIDNDRSPIHANHERSGDLSKLSKADQKKDCRYCEVGRVIESVLGSDRGAWPIPGVIAIPVEMIESWQLLICNPNQYDQEQNLPIFPEKSKSSARLYHTPSNVPEQLKDLVDKEKARQGLRSTLDFYRYCADKLDVTDLMARSPSFTQFAQQVAVWEPA
jgi:hypothetical protein